MKLLRFGLFASFLLLLNSCSTVISATSGDDGLEEDPGRRSVGTMMDDSSIETAVLVNLNAADEGLKKAHIRVVSYDTRVLLVGQVPTEELKALATRVATSSARRIEIVHNELEVAGDTNFLSRTSDTWITAKVKTFMLADKNVSGLRTKVITANGVVYLMGLVSNVQADQAAELASRVSGVVKVVRAFEYTDS
jgi:osmotically-inducible protein OsmY